MAATQTGERHCGGLVHRHERCREIDDRRNTQEIMRGLMTDDDGLTFEYLDADEAAFLYEEIFTRRSYLRHGVHIDKAGSPVILDAGANIGLFGLLCLRENWLTTDASKSH